MKKFAEIPVLTMAWRFTTGEHIDGPKTTEHKHRSWWSKKPRHHRAGIRWGFVLGISIWLWGYFVWRFGTLWITTALLPYIVEKAWKIGAKKSFHTVFIEDSREPIALPQRKNVKKTKTSELSFDDFEIKDLSEESDLIMEDDTWTDELCYTISFAKENG